MKIPSPSRGGTELAPEVFIGGWGWGFQVNGKEKFDNLRFHFGTSSWGGTRKLPYVFTENGVAMLASVLNSKRAIQVNIQIMRTFTKLRELLATHKELKQKIDKMEKKYDYQFKVVFDAIRQLIETPSKPCKKIDFLKEKE